jgi:methyl-accepting chemotaxis protein
VNIFKIARDARLRTKLLAIALAPLFGLTYFAGQVALERRSAAREAAHLSSLIDLSVRIGNLVHETQRERGMTSLYVSAAGKTFQGELESQRRDTDRRLVEFRDFFGEEPAKLPDRVKQNLSAARMQLERLDETRARATRLNGEAKEFIAYYTALNELLLNSIGSIASVDSNADLTRMSSAYLGVLRAKEQMGIERAQLSNVFVNKAFAPGQLVAVAALPARQDAYLRTFADLAGAGLSSAYQTKAASETFARVREYEKMAFEAATPQAFSAEPRTWFQVATLKIDALKEIEDAQARELRDRVGSDKTAADRAVVLALLLWLGITGLAIALTLLLVRQITRPITRVVEVLAAVAKGDLSAKLEVQSTDEIGQITQALNEAVDGIRTVLSDARKVAQEVASASEQLSSASEDISSGAQESAASLEETAANLEEITSTVKQNSENANHAAQLASHSRDIAERGGRIMDSATRAMNEITEASRRIADIIATVDEIAFQTNLLALNAAVEAARAGDHGRGFAAVAAEVRILAQRSAAAAKEIKGLIGDSVTKISSGSQHVNDSGKSLEEIVIAVKRVTDMVGEIAAASREQNTGIEQVNKAVTQMDQVTQANAAQTEEMSSTAAALAEQARQLQNLVAQFRLDDTPDSPPSAATSLPLANELPRKLRSKPSRVPRPGTNGARISPPAANRALNQNFEEF